MAIRSASWAGAFILIAGAVAPVNAAIRCVPLTHPGTCDHRHSTIQEAVDAAAPSGDSIFVAAGTYIEQVAVQGKSVALIGARAGTDARGRVGPESVVSHTMGALLACGDGLVVDGFTFSGATDIDGNWAAVWVAGGYCVVGGSVTFRNNVVRDSICGMIVYGAPVSIERSWFVANNAIPQYSLGLQASAASDSRIERNRFEAHVGPSLELAGTARIDVVGNEIYGRVQLRGITDSTLAGNASAGPAPNAALFELSGGIQRTAFVGNTLSVSSGRAVWLSPESVSDPSSEITLHGNCIRGPGAVGLEVAAGAHPGPLDATANWWGAASGPSGAGPGSGTAVVDPSGVVAFAPFLTSAAACPCAELPDGSPCDDGDPCSTSDTCLSETCRSGTPPACDDANDCTVDSCDPQTGACVHSSAHCSDGDPCTIDSCDASGQCVHSANICDDDNPCTADLCEPAGGCIHPSVSGPCDDDNPCTVNDACGMQGICLPGPPVCADADPCTENICDPGTLACSFPQRDCDDGDPCTADTCTPSTGACAHAPTCADGNPCTDDSCEPATGLCANTNDDSNSCVDGNACTTGERCLSGACVFGSPLACDDGNPCTDDGCNPTTGCVHGFRAGPCDDGNPCTLNDTCTPGGCAPGPLRNCNDGNACTDDSCDPASGLCLNVNDNTNNCMTQGACGTCSAGTCEPVPPNCDDGVGCTVDGCDANGCYHWTDSSRCPADPVPWDCMEPVCRSWGCEMQPKLFNTPCTHPQNCGAGRCGGGGECFVFVPCVAVECEHCNQQTGQCIQDSCDDGNPCTVDYCANGAGFCVHSSEHCADGDPCTTDFCDASGQCAHGATACNDGNPCTDDTCLSGTGCVSQADDANVCDDGNPCTDDVCASGSCQGVADDTNTCTGAAQLCVSGFACDSGACVGVPGQAAEVGGIRFPFGKNTLAWNPAPSGPGFGYQVLRGVLAALPVGSVPSSEACVAETTFTFVGVPDSPQTGSAHWYLVRVTYTACDGSYGSQGVSGAPGAPRVSATCP